MSFSTWRTLLITSCIALLASTAAFSADSSIVSSEVRPLVGKVIGSIDVKGLKRIEKDAVVAKVTSKPGQSLSPDAVRADIQAIHGMGFFDEVEVRGDNLGDRVNLVYVVKERPVITRIEFDGNERISTSDLQEVIKVKEWSILDINKVKEDTALIQKHYEEKGFYLAKVTFNVRPVPGKEDEVELTYRINDYDKVTIKKITFLNNKRYSDEQLKSVLGETREGSLLSFLSGAGNFKESAFKQDLQRLTYWYLEHGYVKFRYENPIVTVSDDKKWLYITIYVEEGEQYTIGSYDFSGDLLFPKEELHKELGLKEGETFAIGQRNLDIQRLTEKYQDLGYAFTNVIPKMNVKDDTKTVDIDYAFEKGNLVYFGEINMVGNSKTHDKVIRRELRIHEGELYSGTQLRISRENVERLGYFAPGEVIFNTKTPKGKPDILDVEISIKERSTGTITLGAGYGSVQHFFFTTQVSEINLLGRGQTISLAAQLAAQQSAKSFNLGFTDPYAFDTRWSMGFDLFYILFPIPLKYNTRKLGFNLRAGYTIFDYTQAFVTYKNEGLKIVDLTDRSGLDPADMAADDGVLSSVVFSLIRDKRNNRFETTDGNYQSVSLETAGIFGDKRFVKAIANSRFYKRLFGDFVFRNSIELGQIGKLGWERVPPSERFYLGGPNNLRGYNLFSVGPQRSRTLSSGQVIQEPLGGLTELYGLFEIEHPLIREAGLKAVGFFDVGNSFLDFPTAQEFHLLTAAGLGLRWFSPIGPLRFEWGFPLNPRPGDDPSVFQFFIGPPF